MRLPEKCGNRRTSAIHLAGLRIAGIFLRSDRCSNETA